MKRNIEVTMKNPEWSIYTYRHRRAFNYLVENLLAEGKIKEEMRKRAKVHDLDKLLLYQLIDVIPSQKYHINHNSHHPESGKCTEYLDMLEMVIDLESAPLTKPDKPLHAYDFLKLLYEKSYINKEFYDKLADIACELNIDKAEGYVNKEDALEYIGEAEDITEEMILLEVIEYVNNNNCPEIEYASSYLR